jgi:hypothetical protein
VFLKLKESILKANLFDLLLPYAGYKNKYIIHLFATNSQKWLKMAKKC